VVELEDICEFTKSDNDKIDPIEKTIFVLLSAPFLIVICFLTIHLIDIFQLPGLLNIILICVYIIILYPIYKISSLVIIKQKKNILKLKKMISSEYKECKFCGKQINIKDFYTSNKKLKTQKIVEIWNNDFYGILCCTCFVKTPSNFWIKIKSYY
jgi:hypothetical protein